MQFLKYKISILLIALLTIAIGAKGQDPIPTAIVTLKNSDSIPISIINIRYTLFFIGKNNNGKKDTLISPSRVYNLEDSGRYPFSLLPKNSLDIIIQRYGLMPFNGPLRGHLIQPIIQVLFLKNGELYEMTLMTQYENDNPKYLQSANLFHARVPLKSGIYNMTINLKKKMDYIEKMKKKDKDGYRVFIFNPPLIRQE